MVRTAVLTTHFSDASWVELLLRRVRSIFPELRDEDIYVIDQDRTATSEALLRERLGEVQILRFPPSEPHFVITGHDHAHVLNLAARAIDCDVLMIFDSDAHPVNRGIRAQLARALDKSDAVLAARFPTGTDTHPCFMVLGPAVDRERLFFDEDQLDLGLDTGRRIFDQVVAMGRTAELARPELAFDGGWGTFYLDGAVYHHGSASFAGAADPRLQAQARRWRREREFFKRSVFAGRYELSRAQSLQAALLRVWRDAPVRTIALLRPPLSRLRRVATTLRLRARARGAGGSTPRAPDRE